MSKKRSSDQKAAHLSISVEFEADAKPAKASILQNGDFVFFDADGNTIEPKRLIRETFHDRIKGPKVRTRIPLESGTGATGGLSQLSKYDVVFAIDTNSKLIGDDFISVSGFIPFTIWSENGIYSVKLGEESIQIYEMHGETLKPELFAIAKLIQDLKMTTIMGRPFKIAVVTDTELGRLDSFNSGMEPIFGESYLPDGLDIIYASTDTGWEITNKLLRLCDQAASAQIEDMEAGRTPESPLVALEDFPLVSIRVGRRNAKISIDQPVISEITIYEGQTVEMWGVK